MADTPKKTTRSKKVATPKTAGVPTAKAVAAQAAAAEVKGQSAPAAVKAAVAAPAPKPAPAPAPAPAPVAKPEPKLISKVERQRMIEQAAYFRAEKHGFAGDSSQHWAAAEAEIDADLKRRNIRVA